MAAPATSKSRERSYQDKFLDLGFYYVVDKSGAQRPQCVICFEVLSTESMKQNKLQRHLTTKHAPYQGKERAFFERKLLALKNTRLDREGTCHQTNSRALEASYRVSLHVAKTKKPHSIAEELVLPCAKDMVSLMVGEEAAKKLAVIPLSDNTIQRRIEDMSLDVTAQVVQKIKESPWHAIQLDESTDIASYAQLIVWVRFIKADNFVDEPLLIKPLEATTKGEDIFGKVEQFYRDHDLDFGKLLGSTTDGTPAMLGVRSGFKAKLLEVAPQTSMVHCMIHREALASRTLPETLQSVLSEVVKMVNHIKSSALNTRLFRLFCQEMDADHKNLLFYTQVRWLSRGNLLLRVYELKDELKEFLRTQGKTAWVALLESDSWLSELCYLVDIFERLNVLNRSLQGKDANLMIFHDKMSGFLATLKLLADKAAVKRFSLFPRLVEHLTTCQYDDTELDSLSGEIARHLRSLIEQFEHYFPELDVQSFSVVRDPFTAPLDSIADEDDTAQEELVQLQQDSGAQALARTNSLSTFWCKMLPSYPTLSRRAIKVLMPYPSSYFCEQSFSTMVVIKTKYRNRLEMEHDMILALSSTSPRIEKLVSEKQAHPSH